IIDGKLIASLPWQAALELIQKALRSAGIPSVLEGEASVFDSPEASEIQRVLRGVAAPLDARAVRAALSTTLLGVSGDELAALQQDEAGWSLWAARFREWHDLWRRSGFIRAYRKILAETRASRRFLSQPGGDRQLTNLFHLGELLEAEAIRRQSGPLELLRWLHVMRQDPLARSEGLASEAAQIRLESDLKAVKLVTIHKSKGLEYDAVYCPYLWQGTKLFPGEERWPRFHDPADRHRLKMDVGSQARQEHLAWATKEEQAERTRLTYVALTRARHLCTVVWGAFRDAEKSPLHVLLMKMPEEVRTADPRDVKWTPIHRLSDEAIHGELKLLEEEAPGAIGVEWFEDELAQEVEDPAARGGKKTMAARTLSRRLSSFWRISSFSALTASEDEEIRPDLPDRDHDAEQEAAGRRDRDAPAPRPEHPVLLDSFPRGSRAGQMIHTVLENIDFRQTDPAALAPAVERALEGYGFPLGFRDRLAAALAAVFKTRLLGQGEGLTLSDLSPEQRLNEMEFTYPVGGHGRTLTSAGLANVLRSEPEPPWPPSYPDQVERTGFLPLEGFLRGFADLVFTYRERWYLVDYKSNHLGPDAADYAPEQLPTVMASHHYFLQYHIYMVALHRYLSFRIRHYDPARHLGGVFYLFLRGMSPEHPAGCGIFRHRPSLQILESLSRLMEDGASRQEWP
ncbi:MAG: 3'-5' exonuclease, partial [Acidobacteriota bacterium]